MRAPSLSATLLSATLVLSALAAGPATAQPLIAGSACGGDAYTTAQVVEGRAPQRGPLVAVPDTLCADLAPQGPPTPIETNIYPIVPPRVGGVGGGVPYGGELYRSRRP